MALISYIIRRLLQTIPVLLGIITITFLLSVSIPGDPVRVMLGPEASPAQIEMVRQRFGLDQPLHRRYLNYLLGVVQGDLGTSIMFGGEPVVTKILERIPYTILLVVSSFTFALAISIPLGIVSALRRNKPVDHVSRIVSLIGVSTPGFWIGLLLIIVFAFHLGWFPASGMVLPWRHPNVINGADTWFDVWRMSAHHLILPTIALGTLRMAAITRIERSTMLDVLNKDYIRLARAYGVPERKIATKHAFNNAQLPVLTIVGLDLTVALGGSVLIETVFNIPGMGRLIIDAIQVNDVPLVMGTTLVFGLIFVVGVLIVDILYAYIDPRVTYDGEN